MLLHSIRIRVENGLEDVGNELLHLLGSAAHEVFGHKARCDFLFGQAKGGVSGDTVYHIVGQALFLDLLAGGDGVLAQALVQLLTVAALSTACIMMFSLAMKGSSAIRRLRMTFG